MTFALLTNNMTIQNTNHFLKGNPSVFSDRSKVIKRRVSYQPICNNIRRKICFENQILKCSLSKVCERYGVNFLTAKTVIQNYQREHRFEKKASLSKDSKELRSLLRTVLISEKNLQCGACGEQLADMIVTKARRAETVLDPASQCRLRLVFPENTMESARLERNPEAILPLGKKKHKSLHFTAL
jgi:hypothetical protein